MEHAPAGGLRIGHDRRDAALIVRILRKEKIGGFRVTPNTIVELPDPVALQLISLGGAVALQPGATMQDNLFGPTSKADTLIRNAATDA